MTALVPPADLPPGVELWPGRLRFRTAVDGRDTRHSFSFGDHYDPGNVGFGTLMAHNDDRLAAAAGYDDHPHRDTEILTWVLSGTLVHKDSTGHRGLVHPGLAQRLSAGSGVVHAERNDAFRTDPQRPPLPVHFVQMWLRPDESGGDPSYDQHEIPRSDLTRDWVPVASGDRADAAIRVGSRGSTLWATVLPAATSRTLPDGPRLHVFVADGEVDAEGVGRLIAGDALRIVGGSALRVTAVRPAELLVWELDR